MESGAWRAARGERRVEEDLVRENGWLAREAQDAKRLQACWVSELGDERARVAHGEWSCWRCWRF